MSNNPYPGRPYPVGPLEWKISPERAMKVAPLKAKRFALLEYGEAEILFDMPRILGVGGTYLNLGHGAGGSAMLLAAGLEDQCFPGTVHSVDLFKREPWSGGYDGTLNKAQKAIEEMGLDDRIQLYQGPTSSFFRHFEYLNFLFIDADHSYSGVKSDFLNFGHKVVKGGAVAFHDTNQEPSHRVIEEDILPDPHWQLIHHVNRIKVFVRV